MIAEDLWTLRRLAADLSAIAGIEEVIDLSSSADIRSDPEDDTRLDTSPLIDFGEEAIDIAAIRSRIRGHPLYRDILISDGQDVLGLGLVLDIGADQSKINASVTRDVLRLLGEADLPGNYFLSGYPFSEVDASRILHADLALLSSAALILISLLVFAVTRSAWVVMLTILAGLWSQVCCAAWFGATGTPLTIVTAIVPTVLLAITTTQVVYLNGLLARVKAAEDAASTIRRWVMRPTLIAAASTIAGFLSLRLMPVDALSDLGTGLAVGVAASTLATLALIPSAIRIFDIRITRPVKWMASEPEWALWGVRISHHPGRVLATCLLLAGLLGAGISQLRIESDPLSYWRPESFHRRSADFVRTHLSGTLPINLVLQTQREGDALDPAVLSVANEILEGLDEIPAVDRTLSFLDYLELMDVALMARGPGHRVPESRALAAQYVLLYESGGDPFDYRHYLNTDRSGLNLFVRVADRSSTTALMIAERARILAADAILRRAEELETAGIELEVEVLGTSLLFPKAMDEIVRRLIEGLALAMVGVFLVMGWALRSLRLACIAMIPTGLPILVFAGLMGWAGLPLSMGTATVGSVVLGLAVDDTAHVLGHLQGAGSLDSTYRRIGNALALTTGVLAAGFGLLLFSEFQPIVHLGIAAASTLVIAFGINWLVLPSLLVLGGVRSALSVSEAGAASGSDDEFASRASY